MKNLINVLLISCMGIVFFSCSKDDKKSEDTAPAGLVEVAEGSFPDGKQVVIYTQDALVPGYNILYFKMRDANGTLLNTLDWDFYPVMTMGSDQMGAPGESPVFNDSAQLYKGAAVFTMDGDWQLVCESGSQSVTVPVAVKAGTAPVMSFTGSDNATYLVTLVAPKHPVTGLNDLEILVDRKYTDMNYIPDSGLVVRFYPEMPSMGHSSPNNIDPVATVKGHYKGTANFTMTGDWRLYFSFDRNGQSLADSTYIDIQF